MNKNKNYELINKRKKKGWTQAALAAHMGVSQQYVAKMENGLKPFSNKALELLETKKSSKRHTKVCPRKKTAKEGVKKALKTKGLQEKRDGNNVQKGGVSAFSKLNAKEWEKYWWNTPHFKCKGCINSCKQSSRVQILACPQFKEIKKP